MDFTWNEISNQPVAWKETLAVSKSVADDLVPVLGGATTHFLFIGCGTSLYLAQSAARSFQQLTGNVSSAVPASEVLLADEAVIPRGVPVVAFGISRSGTTSETVMAVQHLRDKHPNVRTVAVTCHPEGDTAGIAHHTIALPHAAEKSVVMTQSFTSMLLALQYLAASIARNDAMLAELDTLPDVLGEVLLDCQRFGREFGDSDAFASYIYLGLGIYYGLAAEATLKLKEMTQVPCEYYNPLEFRHGPISILEPTTNVIVFAGDDGREYIDAVVRDVRGFGSHVAVVGTSGGAGPEGGVGGRAAGAGAGTGESAAGKVALELPGGLSDWSRTVLYLPATQYLAWYKAKRLGLDPDRPRNLTQVVKL